MASLNLPSSLNVPSDFGSALTSVTGTLNGVIATGTDAETYIKQYGIDELTKFRAKYERPSTNVRTNLLAS